MHLATVACCTSTSTSTLYSNHASTCIEHTDSCSCDLWNRGTGTGIVSRYRYQYHVAASKVMLRLHSAHVPTRGLFLSEKRDLRHELKAVNSASQVQNLLWESCVAM